MSVRSPTAGTWSSSQWRPDNEFETDRVFGGRGGRIEGARSESGAGREQAVIGEVVEGLSQDGRGVHDDLLQRVHGVVA